MSARTLDAGTIADRMNARPLDSSIDGGVWEPVASTIGDGVRCDVCSALAAPFGACVVSGGGAAALLVMCLPCAVADCDRAEAGVRS